MSPTAIAQEVSNAVGIPSPARNHQSRIRTGDLVIDLETQIVTADRMPVPLTGKEYSILELLSRRKGVIVTKEMFLGHLYGEKDEPELKIIDVFVCHLRKSWRRRRAANTTSRRFGAEAIASATRRKCRRYPIPDGAAPAAAYACAWRGLRSPPISDTAARPRPQRRSASPTPVPILGVLS